MHIMVQVAHEIDKNPVQKFFRFFSGCFSALLSYRLTLWFNKYVSIGNMLPKLQSELNNINFHSETILKDCVFERKLTNA